MGQRGGGHQRDHGGGIFNSGTATISNCDETHASYEGCADSTAGPAAAAQAVSERPKVILPEGVRGQLEKRRGLGRFAGGPVTPQ
jgi:hypothetical protein